MVATPFVQDSEVKSFAVSSGPSAGERVSEVKLFSIYNYPSLFQQASSARPKVVMKYVVSQQVSEVRTFAIVQGRVENHKVRAFPFRLDGHDMYCIRLGELKTLIYDITTQKWSRWTSETLDQTWRVAVGNNWTGMGKNFYDTGATADVILGDDTFGLLWTLNAESGVDEHPDPLRLDLPFQRRVIGGVPMRLRDTQSVGAVYITADIGAPQTTGAGITLRTSDTNGKTWVDHGTVAIVAGDYSQEFVWRSIGLIKAPGRIFEVTDNGATVRLDSMDMR